MKPKFNPSTNSFTIAHYILLFFVTTLCICIIAWIIIFRHNPAPTNDLGPSFNKSPAYSCPQRVRTMVKEMWQNDSKSVPAQYWQLASEFMDAPIRSTTYGLCQDVAYVCRPGQRRRDCDPCAVPSARAYAQEVQTIDMIGKLCE